MQFHKGHSCIPNSPAISCSLKTEYFYVPWSYIRPHKEMKRLTLDYEQSLTSTRDNSLRDIHAYARNSEDTRRGRSAVNRVSYQFHARACIFPNLSLLAEIRDHMQCGLTLEGSSTNEIFSFIAGLYWRLPMVTSLFQCIQDEYTITKQTHCPHSVLVVSIASPPRPPPRFFLKRVN